MQTKEIMVANKGDIARVIKERREAIGWTKNKLRTELLLRRGKQTTHKQIDSLEGDDPSSYRIDLLLDALSLLELEIVIREI